MDQIKEVEISRITVKKRLRKELGDLASLVNSLNTYGQLYPIIINKRYELISGQRRLEAAKHLGWTSIKTIFMDKSTSLEMLEMEMEENIERLNFTPGEISNGFDSMDRLRHPGFFRRLFNRILSWLKSLFKI